MLFLLVFIHFGLTNGHDVTRDFYGDIFRLPDCHPNMSRCDNEGRRPAAPLPGRPCYCQCAPSHVVYREDKRQCVKDIRECYMSVFYRPFTTEAIPLVYLPTNGQLVHPDAHLSLAGRRGFDFPKCKAAVSQYLTPDGWRTLTKSETGGGPVFGLFMDTNKTFLQFLGNNQDRKLLQHNLVLVRLFCKIPEYAPFETCVALRVGWIPGADAPQDENSNNRANMMVVGLSLGVLALVYVFAVLVYLRIRRQILAKHKSNEDPEAKIENNIEGSDKTSSLQRSETAKRIEMYHTNSLNRRNSSSSVTKSSQNDTDPWSHISSIVETYNRTWTDRMGQHGCEFRAQDFKIQPEFFEPEFMASPPQQVLEYLERLQNSVNFARHRLRTCYRYQPTLLGIPEDDYFEQDAENKTSINKGSRRSTPDGGSDSSPGLRGESTSKEPVAYDVPKVPPRKPKRRLNKKSSNSEIEQKEIQNAMSTLNDTLDALEFDIFKQDLLKQASDTEGAGNDSSRNSDRAGNDDLDTSSCSSLSAATVLCKKPIPSKCPESNKSRELSVFSNSTINLEEASPFNENDIMENSVNEMNDLSSSRNEMDSNGQSSSDDDTQISESFEQNACHEIKGNALSLKESSTDSLEDNTSLRNNYFSDGETTPYESLENQTSNVGEGNLKCQSPLHQTHSRISTPEPVNNNQIIKNPINKTAFVDAYPFQRSSSGLKSAKRLGDRLFQQAAERVNSPYESNDSQVDEIPNGNPILPAVDASSDDAIEKNSSFDEQKSSSTESLTTTTTESFPFQKSLSSESIATVIGKPVHRIQQNGTDFAHRPLHKSSSSESVTTIATEMTTDSLDSPGRASPTPSLIELWLSRLVSVPYSKSRRKTKKKRVLPEDDVDTWEHVCQKQKDPCPLHESNLIDKLTHYGSKTGCDVAGYFQSLKQDVFKEQLMGWLNANHQGKRKGMSVKYRKKDCPHRKPLVNDDPVSNSTWFDLKMPNWNSNGGVSYEQQKSNDDCKCEAKVVNGCLKAKNMDSQFSNGSITNRENLIIAEQS